jgi:arsenate reductase
VEVVALLIGLTLGAATPAEQARPASNTPVVLFMCPHGAAKSLLASAYFQKMAKDRGLNVVVDSAGTDPDPLLAPAVVAHLTKNGYTIPIAKPRRVTAADLAKADVVVSMGCDLSGLPVRKGALRAWDVPDLSAGFTRADDEIRARVIALVEELISKQ